MIVFDRLSTGQIKLTGLLCKHSTSSQGSSEQDREGLAAACYYSTCSFAPRHDIPAHTPAFQLTYPQANTVTGFV